MAMSVEHDPVGEGGRSPWLGQRMSFEEFLRLPEQKPYLEYIDGVVCQRTVLSPTGSSILMQLLGAMDGPNRKREHGMALMMLDCIVGETFLVPAGSFFRRETLRARGIRSVKQDFGVPDLVVELVPHESSGFATLRKCLRFFELGVAVVLLIDADDELVMTLRRDRAPVVAAGDEQIDFGDMLPGFELTVRALFDAALPERIFGPRGGRDSQADDEAAASERSDGD